MSNQLHVKQGWIRALIFFFVGVLVSGLIASPLQWLIYKGFIGNTDASYKSLMNILLYVFNCIGILSCLWYFRCVIDGLSFFSLGFQWKGFGMDALIGVVVAVLIIGVGTILLVSGENLVIYGVQFNILNIGISILYFILVAFVEEVVVRGYVLSNLMESMNRWLALYVSAFLFTLMHLGNEDITLMAGLNIFIAGILLGVNYIYTKNLWFAIFFHFSWNFFQGSIIGYHVSGMTVDTGLLEITTKGPDEITGGAFGFEGSAFAAILQVIAIIALAMVYEKKYGKRIIKAAKVAKPIAEPEIEAEIPETEE
jgi:membrane protease YdiL (CAAX protease family)